LNHRSIKGGETLIAVTGLIHNGFSKPEILLRISWHGRELGKKRRGHSVSFMYYTAVISKSEYYTAVISKSE
jgi:hypothetical protein